MPPKAKFSSEEMISVALEIVRTEGVDALTARSLGARLGSSARPIFTIFQNMEEVQHAVIEAAKLVYKEYVQKGLAQEHAFKGVGTQYILFSIQEPKLFQLLFMSEHQAVPDLSHVLPLIDDNYDQILLSVQRCYGFNESSAKQLYRHLWIYCHGIATLCATKMCQFTAMEINEMITAVCRGLIIYMKEGNKDDSGQ